MAEFNIGDKVMIIDSSEYRGRIGVISEIMGGGLYDVEIDGKKWPVFENEIEEV